ncbi:tRNA wybutosine-synthesis-related protein 4 [Parastagonospora nodorum]|uniref:tRNA wybutosine-synthesis-related protein 4 n=2 Tax=Phaeosphaeria nodorum (strain SN15 / ATCC MYA-4574 / FGSC 10173) TaxID=321614 RepID=A0A7U2F758_PHANO|nr:hypothetical protein SNOG_06286 [Parastagonospora nodorum SN15]KAH3918895.1 tRNA wybutosine-synthesis-related protein 4 [Parastagonospora nodorum]EAT86117.1 hypothetical protein SNOG_06286 [Parastagonospora nodorum SN15]KAH3934193.1 tRNA wybutosine-synthesis-related protein 4 [Parastagonospora nodorum]KAH3949620.1 tRNA wybutosine-synthesis-related protein 4 [Parastagonospora nodorum]KAH3975886.1 tRNA wybutosine-synthesis-related protein 4 [Parastagonospora nodorum]
MDDDPTPSPTPPCSPLGRAMHNDAPTISEITQLTRQQLTTASKIDPIRECGRAALAILPQDPHTCQQLAYQKLHDVPYRDVKTCWRRLYTDATLWKVVELAEGGTEEEKADWIDEVVRALDMALILTGAPGREELVELWFEALKEALTSEYESERPVKRRKITTDKTIAKPPSSFSIALPEPTPILRYPIARSKEISMSAFQAKVSDLAKHIPMIIEGALQHWPALDERPWSRPSYLLEQTLGGRRLVPVEVGKSYTDEGWGQKIITFKEFMDTYMLQTDPDVQSPGEASKRGYLAQHDLFAQIPSLRADISIPDYCYCNPASSQHVTQTKPTAKLEEPLLNAWFGPAGTVSPLHTDPYHNILAQVVGYKYVRLYAPGHTEQLYPRSIDENGVDMSNTSQVDLDQAIRLLGERQYWQQDENTDISDLEQVRRNFEEQFPHFKSAPYMEAILAPGECLYLPVGWWHYIRSLTPSFSVSFWFN